ncbi:BadF/BadG/BcrA/BcrD ATPase family protein [Alteromonas macleodii]|uniref:BadF/BadG/BcrA/BcrD ATPase family protein n=1 Tax=Alteromonas macleodii TaxID=28108 RepID=UPI0006893003|nr:BadF/BadG/BcrA/BcrD ATPase family protein [Alteromonas macleodii]
MFIGIDVGSTTVKAVVLDSNLNIVWKKYERHNTKQAELVRQFVNEIKQEFSANFRVFLTGSGATPLEDVIDGKFIQEVNAVNYAVQKFHPNAGSVIELGGQDAKIIIYRRHRDRKTSEISMNDKCASGTGATIDKCFLKVGIEQKKARSITFNENKLHKVAAKCGVFAETDIVNLIKSGIDSEEVICSLADAIVQQNLSVLTRGNTLPHEVVLLGGPNTYLPFLVQCWRRRIKDVWNERDYIYPTNVSIDDLIYVPCNSEYYAALGAIYCGVENYVIEPTDLLGEKLDEFIRFGRASKLSENSGPSLKGSNEQLEQFLKEYSSTNDSNIGQVEDFRSVYIGIDGGSTSSKCVCIDENNKVVYKDYVLSKGNPIVDAQILFKNIQRFLNGIGREVIVRGVGVCGYAGDILTSTFNLDVNVVETIAHMAGANHYFADVDVICDVGGQDIKLLLLSQNGLKDFRLSNQCSAGNGMLLQAMSEQFGINVRDFAEHAFQAPISPKFSYGCAVFIDADRVNFQKEGFAKEEIMAGLALVLPKNIWEYVGQFSSLSSLGNVFILQGGTQYNKAALKAQVDYIKKRVPDAKVHVHPHPGEAGALGAAIEAKNTAQLKESSSFIGLESSLKVAFTSKNDASTICTFCPNLCARTFIDTASPDGSQNRFISGYSCEKGTVEDKSALKVLQRNINQKAKLFPDLSQTEARLSFVKSKATEWKPGYLENMFFKKLIEDHKRRLSEVKIGIPRVLNIWSTAPFWRSYFEALGIQPKNILFSPETTEELFEDGNKYGSIDPCFPSKVVQAHVHHLIKNKPSLDFIYFPSITHVETFLENTKDSTSCPIVAGTPNVIRASFTKEVDHFQKNEITYCDGAANFIEPNYLEKQMWDQWSSLIPISKKQNEYAVAEAYKALNEYRSNIQARGKKIIEDAIAEGEVVVLLLARPYHNDNGINHSVTKELQQLGYRVLTINSIPKDKEWLSQFFADKENPLDITDVWPENYSSNSAQKVWGATFAARCSNIAVLDLSSFKCGHDAPIYGLIDNILNNTDTPYCALHDIDANRPQGSIKIRMKTFAYTLKNKEHSLGKFVRNGDRNVVNVKEVTKEDLILIGDEQLWKNQA